MSSYTKGAPTTVLGGEPETHDKEFTVERHYETDLHANSRKQIRIDADDNVRRVLDEAIAAVRVAMPERDATQNGRLRYERNYQRMREAARAVFCQTGQSVAVPKYQPPPPIREEMTTLGADDFRIDHVGAYRETGGRGKSTGVQPAFDRPESDQHQAWLSTQGAAPVDTSGMSPDDAAKARRKRAGVEK